MACSRDYVHRRTPDVGMHCFGDIHWKKLVAITMDNQGVGRYLF